MSHHTEALAGAVVFEAAVVAVAVRDVEVLLAPVMVLVEGLPILMEVFLLPNHQILAVWKTFLVFEVIRLLKQVNRGTPSLTIILGVLVFCHGM